MGLLPLQPELPWYRRFTGREGHFCQLWVDPFVVQQIWAYLCPQTQTEAWWIRWCVLSWWGFHQDKRKAALLVASCRSRWWSDRCLCSESPSWRSGLAILQALVTQQWRRATNDSLTDKLARYKVAQRELMPIAHRNTAKYANNRAEQSHKSTRFRERGMRRFKPPSQAQLFLKNHAAVSNLFNLERHLTSAGHYRRSRTAAFATWRAVFA